MPRLPQPDGVRGLSVMEEVDPADWLLEPSDGRFMAQTLHQQDGYAMTLVIAEVGPDCDDDEIGVEDAYERLLRF